MNKKKIKMQYIRWCEVLKRKKDKARKGNWLSVVGDAGASLSRSHWSSHVR